MIRLSALLLAAAVAAPAAIEVSSQFEGGSIGPVERVSATHLRCPAVGQTDQDHRNRQANWYYFRLDQLPSAPVTIDLVHLAGEYNYHGPVYAVTKGTRPVYSYDGEHWTHFSDDQVEWVASEPLLRLHFTPQHPRMWIAHVEPYTNRHLAALLDFAARSPYCERRSVGKTVDGREMPLITITNPKVPEKGKKVVWLMFRQHAWEAGSSWACEGAVRYLLSDDPHAARLRDKVIYRIFPMADPDGVAAGGVRFNKYGYDLNRNWDAIDPQKMPEIAAQHQAILQWVDRGHRIDLFLSLHNTESGEYLEAPRAFQALGTRLRALLAESTTFAPTVPLRESGDTTTPGKPGRMTVAQGLFHDRKIPAMLMEQMVQYNARLGRCPTAADRRDFGAGLVRTFGDALTQ
ncbi:MAG TPA: M14-type cytosolic carboxypeptidase [Bryobacteraceae bacterium]|nr:M14-type cytosolic carboxypeptidase [Bryobacteraceae bacterium]